MSNSNFSFAGWILADLFLIMAIIFLIATPAKSVTESTHKDKLQVQQEKLTEEHEAVIKEHKAALYDLNRVIRESTEQLNLVRQEKRSLEEQLRTLETCRQEVDFKFDQLIFYEIYLTNSEHNLNYQSIPREALDSNVSIYMNLDQEMTNVSETKLQGLGVVKFNGGLVEYFSKKASAQYRIALIQTFGYASKAERDRGNMTTRSRKLNSTLIPELRDSQGLYYSYALPLSVNMNSQYDGWHTALYSGLIQPNTVRANIYFVKTQDNC